MPFGIVKHSELKKNRDGAAVVRMLQVEISDPEDLQSVELISQSGEDYNPPVGSRVVIAELGDAFKAAIACDDGIVPSAAEGARRVYSHVGGVIKAIAEFLVDGTIKLNTGSGTAVEFARLKTAFDQLKADFDNFVTVKYNLHNHPTAPVGPVSPPSLLGSSSTADINPAESDTVALP